MSVKNNATSLPCIVKILPTEIFCRILKFLYKTSHWYALELTNRYFRTLIRKECWAKRLKIVKITLKMAWCEPLLPLEMPSIQIAYEGQMNPLKIVITSLLSHQSFLDFWSKCSNIRYLKIQIVNPKGQNAAVGIHPRRIVPDPLAHRCSSFCDLPSGINAPCHRFLQILRNAQKISPVKLSHFSVITCFEVNCLSLWQPPTFHFIQNSLQSLISLHLEDTGIHWKSHLDQIQQIPQLSSLYLRLKCSRFSIGLRKPPEINPNKAIESLLLAIEGKPLSELKLRGFPWKEGTTVIGIRNLISKLTPRDNFTFDVSAPILLPKAIEQVYLQLKNPLLDPPPLPFQNRLKSLTLGQNSGWMKVVPHLVHTMPRLEKVIGIHLANDNLQYLQQFPFNYITPRTDFMIIAFSIRKNALRFSYFHFIQEIRRRISLIWKPPNFMFTASLVEHSHTSSTLILQHPEGTLRLHIPEDS